MYAYVILLLGKAGLVYRVPLKNIDVPLGRVLVSHLVSWCLFLSFLRAGLGGLYVG